MKVIDHIFQPLNEGKHFVIANGRSFSDITIDENNRLILLNEFIRSQALSKGFIMIEYSKAEGIVFDLSSLTRNESDEVRRVITNYGIVDNLNKCNNSGESEFASIIRGIIKLVQSSNYPTFKDGQPMRFVIIIKFAEDLMPKLQAGTHTEDQIIAIELCTVLSRSLALRKNGSFILIREEREGTLDTLISKNIPVLRIPQPDEQEKSKILEQLKIKYPNAKYDEAIDDDVVLNSSKNSPNKGLDSIFLASDKCKKFITTKDLFVAKQEDIISRSEKTLDPVDFNRVKNVKLVGRNIGRVLEILHRFTESLKKGDETLRNIILTGAPSTGKTDLAIWAAKESGIISCFFNPPKNSLVGESERLMRVAGSLIREIGGLFILDEVEKIFPMNSGNNNLDSGVSDYILGYLQNLLSDSSLAGTSGFLATTNNPHKMSEAMGSRWVIVPVLQSLQEDFPEIILTIAKSMDKEIQINISDSDFREAAQRFYLKGSLAREIRESIIISRALIPGQLGIEQIVHASKNIMSSNRRNSLNFCDLVSIQRCSARAFLPFNDLQSLEPDLSYPFPDHIQEILLPDGNIDPIKLNKAIRELEPFANI